MPPGAHRSGPRPGRILPDPVQPHLRPPRRGNPSLEREHIERFSRWNASTFPSQRANNVKFMAWTCAIDRCDRLGYAVEMCEMHHRRVLRIGDPGPPEKLDRSRVSCRAPDCDQPAEALGFCHGHYLRLRRSGSADESPLRRPGRLCSIDDCARPHKAKGYRAAHYKRFLLHGSPLPDRPIRESDGNGHISHGYRQIPVPRELRPPVGGVTKVGEHLLVTALHLGRPLRSDEVVHHRSGNRTDIENLELWTTSRPKGRGPLNTGQRRTPLANRATKPPDQGFCSPDQI